MPPNYTPGDGEISKWVGHNTRKRGCRDYAKSPAKCSRGFSQVTQMGNIAVIPKKPRSKPKYRNYKEKLRCDTESPPRRERSQ